MHFRHRGNSVQVVRSEKDAETGKAKATPLGSLRKPELKIPDPVAKACTPAELAEINRFIEDYTRIDSLKAEVVARSMPETLPQVAAWLGKADEAEARALAAELVGAWQQVRRAIVTRNLI